jgi:triosephosphate isomerase (TIM)
MKTLIAANWKMNKDAREAVSFVSSFKKNVKKNKDVEIVICPAFTLLIELKKAIKNTNIKLGAQNMHSEEKGAYTGEISAKMLKDLCEYVILGHSERRQYFWETDELINRKLKAALNYKLKPILCIGETSEQRQKNQTLTIIKNQLISCLKNIEKNQINDIVIAYEPIWAISGGDPNHKAATAQDAQGGHVFVREILSHHFDGETAKKVRIIYGGSMKPENASELLSMPDINGGLVGGASLDPKSFADICNFK